MESYSCIIQHIRNNSCGSPFSCQVIWHDFRGISLWFSSYLFRCWCCWFICTTIYSIKNSWVIWYSFYNFKEETINISTLVSSHYSITILLEFICNRIWCWYLFCCYELYSTCNNVYILLSTCDEKVTMVVSILDCHNFTNNSNDCRDMYCECITLLLRLRWC